MKMKIFVTILVIMLVGAGAAGTYYYYTKYQEVKSALSNPELLAQTEVKNLTDKLGKLMELPEGEEPTVATVLDQEKLKDQEFFARSQNGDKIVIYAQKKIAILYRESDNKIIEVAPLAIDNSQQAETATQDETVATPRPTPTPEASPLAE